MLHYILIWGTIGLCIGQLASQYLEGSRWNGHNGDLGIGFVGSLLGGINWLYNGQAEGLFEMILYSAIGSLALLLIVRIIVHKSARRQLMQLWIPLNKEIR